jgi:hypothetical protein
MDATIKGSFWTDQRVEEVSPEIKLTCLWLVTNPARDLCGFTQVSNKRFTFETGLAVDFLEGACKGLASSFVKLADGVFFAVNFLRHQFGKGGRLSLGNKVVIAAARHARKLPGVMRDAFFAAYPELLELLETDSKNLPKNNPPSIPHTVKRDGVREGARAGAREEAMEEGSGEKPPDFADIVGAYPKREAVAEALGHVARSVKNGADPSAILTGTRAIAAVIGQLPSGHLNAFVVSAATFFKNERWRDDPQTWLRSGAAKNGAAAGSLKLGGREAGSMTRVNS